MKANLKSNMLKINKNKSKSKNLSKKLINFRIQLIKFNLKHKQRTFHKERITFCTKLISNKWFKIK